MPLGDEVKYQSQEVSGGSVKSAGTASFSRKISSNYQNEPLRIAINTGLEGVHRKSGSSDNLTYGV